MTKKGTSSWGLRIMISILVILILLVVTGTATKENLDVGSIQLTKTYTLNDAKQECMKQCLVCFSKDKTCTLPKDKKYIDNEGKPITAPKCSDLKIPCESSSSSSGGSNGGVGGTQPSTTSPGPATPLTEEETAANPTPPLTNTLPAEEPTTPTGKKEKITIESKSSEITSIPLSDIPLKWKYKEENYGINHEKDSKYFAIETSDSYCDVGKVMTCKSHIEYTYKKEKTCFYDFSGKCEWEDWEQKCQYLHKETIPLNQQCKNWECTKTGWQPTNSPAKDWCDNFEGYEPAYKCDDARFTDNIRASPATFRYMLDDELACWKDRGEYVSWYCYSKQNRIYKKKCDNGCAEDPYTGYCA